MNVISAGINTLIGQTFLYIYTLYLAEYYMCYILIAYSEYKLIWN